MSKFCQLWLTCNSGEEADKISDTLLVKHLVACVRQFPVNSEYWWKAKRERTKEVILMMESRLDLFEQVEKEVAKHHSYKSFVLEATPVEKISKKATDWLNRELLSGER